MYTGVSNVRPTSQPSRQTTTSGGPRGGGRRGPRGPPLLIDPEPDPVEPPLLVLHLRPDREVRDAVVRWTEADRLARHGTQGASRRVAEPLNPHEEHVAGREQDVDRGTGRIDERDLPALVHEQPLQLLPGRRELG